MPRRAKLEVQAITVARPYCYEPLLHGLRGACGERGQGLVPAMKRIWCRSRDDARRVWLALFFSDKFAAMLGSNLVFSDVSHRELPSLMESLGVGRVARRDRGRLGWTGGTPGSWTIDRPSQRVKYWIGTRRFVASNSPWPTNLDNASHTTVDNVRVLCPPRNKKTI